LKLLVEFVPRTSSTLVATWFWQTEGRSAERVILGVRPSEFILSEFQSPSRRIFIGSHSLPLLWSPNRSFRRLGAWSATCAARAVNGAPRAVRRLGDQRHLAQPLVTDGTSECSPALRSDQRSHQRLGVRARSGYGAYGGWPTWPRMMSCPNASRRSQCCWHFTEQFSK
jgi:hypothetical protein